MSYVKEAWALHQTTIIVVFVVAPAIISFMIGLLFYFNDDSESIWKTVRGCLLAMIDIYLLELTIFVIITMWTFVNPIVGIIAIVLSIIGSAVYTAFHYDIAIALDVI